MPDARDPSALRALRERTRMRVQRGPSELRVDPTLPGEEGALTFCPLLERSTARARRRLPPGRYNRGGMCGSVDCGRCTLLREDLEDRQPDHAWVCSSCTSGFVVEPYWADGVCAACGRESIVLVLATPKE